MKELSPVALFQTGSPGTNLRVTIKFVETGRPARILVEQIDQHIHSLGDGGIVFELCNAPRFVRRDISTPECDEQNAKMTSGEPLLREFLRLIGSRCPIFHGVYEHPCPPQRVDDVRTVVFKVLVGR